MNRSSRRDRGFVLLIVLWTMVLLAVLMGHLTASGRSESQLARNLRNDAITEASADAAIYETVYHLMAPGNAHWQPAGTYVLAVPHGIAEVRIENLTGRVNPNTASPELLAALMQAIGFEQRISASIAAAIVDWRSPGRMRAARVQQQYREAGRDYAPPGTPVRDVQELSGVLGMTADILANLAPHLTIFSEGDPDPAFADPMVLEALRQLGEGDAAASVGQNDNLFVAITAAARGPQATRFARQAVVRITLSPRGRGWHVLAWDRVSI
jgi:general secretion pathway protein K